MAEFDARSTGFWGAVAAVCLLGKQYFEYAASRKVLGPLPDPDKKGENMENEKVGIKETKEVLDGLNSTALIVVKVAKDGIDLAKDSAILYDELIVHPEYKAKMIAAFDNIKAVPSEIKDIDFMEGIDLAKFEYDGVKSIIDELKK